jgi:crotonobetainyl-CoA:carnitine CoA-transferase CaiB-like acyl-CoA transferase
VRGDAEWQALCRVLDRPAWRTDPRFATHADRLANADDLDALVAGTTREREARELMECLQAAGIAAGVVQSALDLHADPTLAGWGFFQWLEHPARPPAPYEGHALRLADTPGRLRWAAPTLGEHTTVVLREILGMSEAEVARLIEAKIAW